jgi:hypothetical protein
MQSKYKLSKKEIRLFSSIKSWHLDGLFNKTSLLCNHHFKENLDDIIAFVEKYKKHLPLIEIAEIKEKICIVDRSKYIYGREAIDSFLKLSDDYLEDVNPNQYINQVLGYLYRSYKFSNADKKQEIIDKIYEFMSFKDLSSELKSKLIYFVVELKIKPLYKKVKNISNSIVNKKITTENEIIYRKILYPSLLKIKQISEEFIVKKLYHYVISLEDANPFLAERICRELQKIILDKGLQKTMTEDLDIKIANLLSKSNRQLFSSEPTFFFENTAEVTLPDLEGMKMEEILDQFFSFPLMDKDEILDSVSSNIILSIASVSSNDSEGRKRSDNSISNMSSIISSPHFMMLMSHRQSRILTFLLSMQNHPNFTRENIHSYYRKFISKDFYKSLSDSLYFFIKEEFHISLPIIIPRFESFLKLCLKSKDILPSKTKADKFDHPKGLSSLLENCIDNNFLSSNEKFEIDCLLFDKDSGGKIVRHEVAHGSLTDDAMGDVYKVNALWVTLRILTNIGRKLPYKTNI